MTSRSDRMKCRRPRSSDFDLQYDRPEMFVKAQFGPPWISIIWHVTWAAYLTTSLLVEILVYAPSEMKPIWLIYSKNWSYLLLVFAAIVEFASRLVSLVVRKDIIAGNCRKMPWYFKLQWVFLNTNNVISVLVAGLYCIVLTPEISFVCLNRIISPPLYVLLTNILINVHPVKVFHFYQPSALAIVYVIVAAIVQRTSNDVQRDTFVFRSDKTTESAVVSVCVISIAIPLIHMLLYSLYKLRICLCNSKHFSTNRSGSTCSLHAIQRDTTTTDVVLEDDPRVTYIDLKPDVRDDIALHLGYNVTSGPMNTSASAHRRINKSETDLRDYRSRNGLYCDFAPASDIFHHRTELDHVDSPAECSNGRASGDTSKGSQIILVKACNGHVNHAFEDDEFSSSGDDLDSNASSDYLSEYIHQDILPYM